MATDSTGSFFNQQMIALPLPGIHHGVPFELYKSWPALNFSTLKEMRGTASKCKYAVEHPKAMTPAMVLGSALHVATLEPARFESMFHICPPCDRRKSEGKEFYAQETLKAEGKIMIRQGSSDDEAKMGEVESVRGMANAIHASKAASLFVKGEGQNEVSMLWQDAETGLMCKARVDRVVPTLTVLGGVPVLVELKSCRDADDYWFGKDVHARGYAIQAASYRHGYSQITGKSPAHVFIAVENFPPHDLKVYLLDDASMQTGYAEYRGLLTRYAECVKSGKWPGYEDKINTLELPKWAQEN